MKYQICSIQEIEIQVPSTDFYARRGDSESETIEKLLRYTDLEFDSFEEAVDEIKKLSKGTYTILPIFKIS